MIADEVKTTLVTKFKASHVDAALRHYLAADEKYVARDWDGVALKAGKFVEAVTKALMIFCGKTPTTNTRHFKAGLELRNLEGAGAFPDTVRIVIPKACIFIYEVVNNRGGRHDPGEIDANEIDAKAIMPLLSWVMAEMVRFSSVGMDLESAMELIDELTTKTHPYFENIDGRGYINVEKLKPAETALLLLYAAYPKRVTRKDLIEQVERHGASDSAAATAVHRLQSVVDDRGGNWKLRGIGRQRAEDLLGEIASRARRLRA